MVKPPIYIKENTAHDKRVPPSLIIAMFYANNSDSVLVGILASSASVFILLTIWHIF
jgi:hypothetical protein